MPPVKTVSGAEATGVVAGPADAGEGDAVSEAEDDPAAVEGDPAAVEGEPAEAVGDPAAAVGAPVRPLLPVGPVDAPAALHAATIRPTSRTSTCAAGRRRRS